MERWEKSVKMKKEQELATPVIPVKKTKAGFTPVFDTSVTIATAPGATSTGLFLISDGERRGGGGGNI